MLTTLISPTGDRHVAFELCEQFMDRQTYKADVQWIVVDDGHQETPLRMNQQQIRLKPTYSGQPRSLANNILNAIPHMEGEAVLVIEDDDWYSPDHIAQQVRRIEKGAIIAGHGLQEYYHLPSMRHRTFRNVGSCFCQTAFHRKLLPNLESAAKRAFEGNRCGLDRFFWESIPRDQWNVFYDADRQVIGMKGIPGRLGLGIGHTQYQNWTADPQGAKLREWTGEDADIYLQLRRKYNLH